MRGYIFCTGEGGGWVGGVRDNILFAAGKEGRPGDGGWVRGLMVLYGLFQEVNLKSLIFPRCVQTP